MKLFATTRLSWTEPTFFPARIRDKNGWFWRLALALLIAGVMLAAFVFDRNFQQRMTLPGAILLSLAIGVLLTAMLDVASFHRDVSISDDSVSCLAIGGTMVSAGSWALGDIRCARLLTADELGRSFGMLVLELNGESIALGVPGKMPVARIASVLHGLGVPVELAGWEPADEQAPSIKEEVVLPLGPQGVAEPARVWPVPASEPRLTPAANEAVAFVIALGPLTLALLAAIGGGVWLFLRWAELAILDRGLWIGGLVAAVVVSFLWLLWAGESLANRHLIRARRASLRLRTEPVVNAMETGLIPVEIFDRETMQSSIVRTKESGFLWPDPGSRCLLFEGSKHRWRIPAGSLQRCRVEEVRVGPEREGEVETRYYVVVGAEVDGQPWESPLVRTRTELGASNNATRLEAARQLLARVAAILPGATTLPTPPA